MPDDTSSRPVVLRAAARHRAVICYNIAPGRLAPHLPAGLVPDLYDGAAWLWLAGTRLRNMRVLSRAVPGLRRVPAVELQSAVRHPDTGTQGTVTMQAYTPRRLVAGAARLLYGDPVATAEMQPVRRDRDGTVELTYRFDWRGREQRLRVEGRAEETEPKADGVVSFVQGRPWRFAAVRGAIRRARIDRPTGPVRPAEAQYVTMRWRAAFREVGALLEGRSPAAAWIADGGPLTLWWREQA